MYGGLALTEGASLALLTAGAVKGAHVAATLPHRLISIGGYVAGGCYALYDTASSHHKLWAELDCGSWWLQYASALLQLACCAVVGAVGAETLDLPELASYPLAAACTLGLNTGANKLMEGLLAVAKERGWSPLASLASQGLAVCNGVVVLAAGRRGGPNLLGGCAVVALLQAEAGKAVSGLTTTWPLKPKGQELSQAQLQQIIGHFAWAGGRIRTLTADLAAKEKERAAAEAKAERLQEEVSNLAGGKAAAEADAAELCAAAPAREKARVDAEAEAETLRAAVAAREGELQTLASGSAAQRAELEGQLDGKGREVQEQRLRAETAEATAGSATAALEWTRAQGQEDSRRADAAEAAARSAIADADRQRRRAEAAETAQRDAAALLQSRDARIADLEVCCKPRCYLAASAPCGELTPAAHAVLPAACCRRMALIPASVQL